MYVITKPTLKGFNGLDLKIDDTLSVNTSMKS